MRQSILSSLILGIVLSLYSLPTPAQQPQPVLPANSAAPTGSVDVYFINRAKNLARQAAIKANGGLERYRPDPRMFGPAIQTQYVRNSDGSITFSFTGSTLGGSSPSIETVATVIPDGSVRLDYNGPLRSQNSSSTLPPVNPSLPVQIPVPSPVPSPLPVGSSPKLPASSSGLPGLKAASTPPVTGSSVTVLPVAGAGVNSDRPLTAADEDAFFAKARNLARQAAIKANGGLSRYRPEAAMFGPTAQTPAVKNGDGSITFTFKGGVPGTAAPTVESVATVNLTGNVNLTYNGPVR
jgi:hypothetical protein